MADGNIRFELFDALIEIVEARRPGGLRPATVRRYLETNRVRLTKLLEPLVPYYVPRRPGQPTSPKERTDANIAALELLARLDAGHEVGPRQMNRVLGRFSGWGGLSIELNQHRFPKGYEQDSIALAHEWYTSYRLADAIADATSRFLPELADGRGRLKALEPSAGVGRFIDAFNRRCTDVSIRWWAVELNRVAAEIIRRTQPKTTVFSGPFEGFNARAPEHLGTWNLLVANPPFGSQSKIRVYASEDPAREYAEERYDYAYFLRRGLDALAYNGIGVFIVPNRFMTGSSDRALRERILLRHHLMAAFRLPSVDAKGRRTFTGQITVTDVVFFRCRGDQLLELSEDDEYVAAGDYFQVHPDHLLGREETREEGSYRYAVVGEFDGLPEFKERHICEQCTIGEALGSKRETDEVSLLRRQLVRSAESTADDPTLRWASSLGLRLDEYLARIAAGETDRARAQWRELHNALVSLSTLHGNPWEWAELLSLQRGGDAGVQALLRGFERDGSLTAPLRQPPADEPRFTADPNDAEALARWLFRAQRSLTIGELHKAHESRGGTRRRDELLRELIATGRWFRAGDPWEAIEPAEIYLAGDLWPKYDRLQGIDDPQAEVQAQRLLEVIEPRTFEDLQDLSPQVGWMPLEITAAWMGATINGAWGAPELSREDGIVVATGDESLTPEANWCLGWINHNRRVFSPNAIEDEREFEGLDLPEVIHTERRKAEELGEDESVDIRRVLYETKWLASFSAWLEADDERREQATDAYNRIFRGQVAPEYDAQPLEIVRWTRDPKLQLKPHQIKAVKARAATRGGILGFDVGVGKTFTCLAIVALGRQEGWIRRPVIVVPAGIVWQWHAEVERVLPDYNVAVIGSRRKEITKGENKGKLVGEPDDSQERSAKWTGFQAGLYDLVLLTDSALGKTQVTAEDVADYAKRRTAIMRSVRMSQENAERRKPNKRSERDKALLKLGVIAWVKDTLRQDQSEYDPGLTWGDLGIDFLAYDEAGNIRRTWSPQPREFGLPKYMGSGGPGSWRAWQADFRASIVRKNTGGTGILGLTGTLGENSPLEIYNIFQFIDPTIFEAVGILDPEQFIDRYLQLDTIPFTAITGEIEPARAVTGFKNLRELRELLFRWGNFVSARDAGLKLPKSRECLASVELDDAQEELYDALRRQARTALRKGQKGTAFAAISRMRLAAIHAEIMDGYDWRTANGGVARKKVTQQALPYWEARGWERQVKVLERELAEAPALKKPKIQARLDKLRKRESKVGVNVSIQRLLPPPKRMEAPKFEACAERVLRSPNCGHIIFSQFTATHYWLREVLVEYGIPRERIGIINGSTGDIPDIASKFNGSETEEPSLDVVIANSKAYRGVNLQRRTCAIHNIDLTWTPADLEQRRGRGDRQGNTLPAIQIWYYMAEGSFDGFMFGLVSGKARWQDKLYRSDEDRSTNPAAQLNLSDSELLRLTASSPEEAEQLERELAAERKRREDEQAEANALRQMRQAAARFRDARKSRSGARKQRLIAEAEQRLRVLASMRDDVWPWKALQERARDADMIVPAETTFVPIFEGLQVLAEDGRRLHFGTIRGNKVGRRSFGDYRWEPVEEGGYQVRGRPASPEEWPAVEDEEKAAEALAKDLGSGDIEWPSIGWGWAEASWSDRAWQRWGGRLVIALARSEVALPVIDDSGLRIVSGSELVRLAERVLPPTSQGWAVYRDQADASLYRQDRLKALSELWWGRDYARSKAPQLLREAAEGETARRRTPVICPDDVFTLRPRPLVDVLTPIWEALDRSPQTWSTAVMDLDLPLAESGEYRVAVGFPKPPSASEFVEAVNQRLFQRHVGLAVDLDERERALVEGYSKQRWFAVQRARERMAEHFDRLAELLGEEAARVLDHCARRSVSRQSSEGIQEIIAEVITPYSKMVDWSTRTELQKKARRDLKQTLRAHGVDEWRRLAEEAIDQATKPEVVESAPAAIPGDKAVATVADLPASLVEALAKVDYRKETIDLEAQLTDNLRTVSGQGRRGAVAVVDMGTGKIDLFYGSWGGPSPFAKSPVDFGEERTMRPNLAHAHVSQGGKGSFGYIVLHPETFARLRPALPDLELGTGEKLALATIMGFRPGYRAREFSDRGLGSYGSSNPWIKGLIREGLVKIVGNGIRVTPEGKALRHQLDRHELGDAFEAEQAAEREEEAKKTAERAAEEAAAERRAAEAEYAKPTPTGESPRQAVHAPTAPETTANTRRTKEHTGKKAATRSRRSKQRTSLKASDQRAFVLVPMVPAWSKRGGADVG